jgi:hypothetical protein
LDIFVTFPLCGQQPKKEALAPTFKEFSERFVVNYAEAENKPSEVATKRRILRPPGAVLGAKRLGTRSHRIS